MEDGFDHGAAGQDPLSMLRSAASERLRQMLGPDGPGQGQPAAARRDGQRGAGRTGRQRPRSSRRLAEQRQLLRDVVDTLRAERAAAAPAAAVVAAEPEVDRLADPLADAAAKNAPEVKNKRELQVKAQVMPLLMQRIDISVASALGPEELRNQIAEIVEEIIVDLKIQLNATELRSIVRLLVDDMVGLGPLEPLLKDDAVTDIMVNGPHQVYVERKGKVELTDVAVPRRPPRAARRHPHRHRGRPPGRRVDAAGRRPPQGRQPRQHHHPAARHRRPDHLDPQVLQEGDHARRDGAAGQHLRRHGDGAEDRRPRRGSTS